jgi:hypothetical protein
MEETAMLLSRLGAFPELRPGLERTDDDQLRRQVWLRLVPEWPVDGRAGLGRWRRELASWPDYQSEPDRA